MLTPAQYVDLKAELATDPATYGYSVYISSGNDVALRLMLTHPRDGARVPQQEQLVNGVPTMVNLGNPGVAISVRRIDVSAADVLETIDNRDFIATPNSLHVAWFESMTQARVIQLIDESGNDTRALGNLRRLLENPGTQGSRARLTQIANKIGSRAEQLFGTGVSVDDADIARALRATP